MNVIETELRGVRIIEPRVFEDARGFFLETYAESRYRAAGIDCRFVQDNHAHSRENVVRGLHYQVVHPQAKLVQVVSGRVLDVAVDIRRGSPSFGKSVCVELSAANKRQLFLPAGCAHGVFVLEQTDFLYKCSDYYYPEHERGILYSDPELGIPWPRGAEPPRLSPRDAGLPRLEDIPTADLPEYVGI